MFSVFFALNGKLESTGDDIATLNSRFILGSANTIGEFKNTISSQLTDYHMAVFVVNDSSGTFYAGVAYKMPNQLLWFYNRLS